MVGRRVKLVGGYSFYIAYRGKKWFANRVYSDVRKAQVIMLEVMKAGNLCNCPLLAIGQDVVYKQGS
ncbi:MAG: hypothetical protein K9L84_05430 [Candidatus Omnitrophica bacterium]|nr:hypothetical protein [Candidatus Omnitrophota bacterium]